MKLDQYSLLKEKLISDKHSSIFILVDDNTDKFCLNIFKEKSGIKKFNKIIIKSGEENKNIESCLYIWDQLNEFNADRKSLLINLGGGVLTDMGGFCASTYLRGISFINIPTTLLGMVDAAHGGKTGIDFKQLKNQIGVFKDPLEVILDSDYLKTLSKDEFINGYAECLAKISSYNEIKEEIEKCLQELDYSGINVNFQKVTGILEDCGYEDCNQGLVDIISRVKLVLCKISYEMNKYKKKILHFY